MGAPIEGGGISFGIRVRVRAIAEGIQTTKREKGYYKDLD